MSLRSLLLCYDRRFITKHSVWVFGIISFQPLVGFFGELLNAFVSLALAIALKNYLDAKSTAARKT